jgi:hypothetical protein
MSYFFLFFFLFCFFLFFFYKKVVFVYVSTALAGVCTVYLFVLRRVHKRRHMRIAAAGAVVAAISVRPHQDGAAIHKALRMAVRSPVSEEESRALEHQEHQEAEEGNISKGMLEAVQSAVGEDPIPALTPKASRARPKQAAQNPSSSSGTET